MSLNGPKRIYPYQVAYPPPPFSIAPRKALPDDLRDVFEILQDDVKRRFTELSQETAERAQLIMQLKVAREKKRLLVGKVFEVRSQIVRIYGVLDVIRRDEEARLRREENDKESRDFLETLRNHSVAWT